MDYLSPGTFVALFVILALILALKRSKLVSPFKSPIACYIHAVSIPNQSVLDVYLFFAILHGSSRSVFGAFSATGHWGVISVVTL